MERVSIRNVIIKQTLSKSSRQEKLYSYDDMIKLYINLPYMGYAGKQLVRSCIKKLKRNIRKEVQVKFVVTYNTTKLSFFTNSKDRITKLASSNAFYHFFLFAQNVTTIILKKLREHFGKG